MYFDTTNSNACRVSGACTIFEQLLGRPLPHFGCRHHNFELVLAAAFDVCVGPSKGPEIIVFKRFQAQWTSIDQESFQDVFSDNMASAELFDIKDEMIVFCEQQLLDHQPRNNYGELLTYLVVIFLGRKPSNWKNY